MNCTIASLNDVNFGQVLTLDKNGNKYTVGLYNEETKEYTHKSFDSIGEAYTIFEKLSRCICFGEYSYSDRKAMINKIIPFALASIRGLYRATRPLQIKYTMRRPPKSRLEDMKMFYVYCKHIKTGKEDFVNCYETAQQAIEKIANNYNIDKRINQLGEYYYFMKQR